MRTLFLIMVALIVTSAVNAQTFEVKSGGKGGFNVDGPGITETKQLMDIDGESFVVWKTEKGAKFMKCLSPNSGNLYPVWVGEPTEHRYDGRVVYQMKSGTYCVYKVSAKTGNPYPVYLNKK